MVFSFFFQAEDGIRDLIVTGVQTCALPIFDSERRLSGGRPASRGRRIVRGVYAQRGDPRRSEEHTSELQSRSDLVCRLLLEKKKKHPTSTAPQPPPATSSPSHCATPKKGTS